MIIFVFVVVVTITVITIVISNTIIFLLLTVTPHRRLRSSLNPHHLLLWLIIGQLFR